MYVSGLESTLVGISLSVDSKGTYVAPKWGAPARELLWGEGQLRPFAPQTHPERKRGASLRLSRNDAFDLRSHTLTVALSEMTLAGGLAYRMREPETTGWLQAKKKSGSDLPHSIRSYIQ